MTEAAAVKELGVILHNGRVRRRAVLTLPRGKARVGLVALHPANNPSRHQPLFDHLARLLPADGVAVLRYDRRATVRGDDVPFEDQASDALAAIRWLRNRNDVGRVSIGVWGWSQGAWVGAITATDPSGPDFLVLLACTGVTPAVQMRYGTAEHVRRAHFGSRALAELAELRSSFEEAIRDPAARETASRLIRKYRSRGWFSLACVPRVLPRRPRWRDMDFDPRPVFDQIVCPTLLFYGARDEWTPIAPSIQAWQDSLKVSHNPAVRIVRLPGTGHAPIFESGDAKDSISPRYTTTLRDWNRTEGRAAASPL